MHYLYINANIFIEHTELLFENQMSFKFRLCSKFTLFCYLNFIDPFQKINHSCTFKLEISQNEVTAVHVLSFCQNRFLINGTSCQNMKTRKNSGLWIMQSLMWQKKFQVLILLKKRIFIAFLLNFYVNLIQLLPAVSWILLTWP